MIENLDQLRSLVGQEVAASEWMVVSQDRIRQFAAATDDHQWIHVDPERAQKESPYGTAIAHGFLTLSLLVPMASVVRVPGIRMGVNYGLDRVRFPAPVPAGARIRARFTLKSLEDIDGGVKAFWTATVEREGGDKPCCVAEWITLYYR